MTREGADTRMSDGAVIRHTAYFSRRNATFMLIVHHWVPFGPIRGADTG